MKKQKGFASQGILIIAALVLIGGGAYYLGTMNTNNLISLNENTVNESPLVKVSPSPTAPVSSKAPSILVTPKSSTNVNVNSVPTKIPDPAITITSPKVGEKYSNSSPQITFSWKTNYKMKEPYVYLWPSQTPVDQKQELNASMGKKLIIGNEGGTDILRIDGELEKGTYYKIFVCDAGITHVTLDLLADLCAPSGDITMTQIAAPKSNSDVTLISPNGDKVLKVGSEELITWKTNRKNPLKGYIEFTYVNPCPSGYSCLPVSERVDIPKAVLDRSEGEYRWIVRKGTTSTSVKVCLQFTVDEYNLECDSPDSNLQFTN